MICEAFNKMGQFVDYVFDDNWYYKYEIELWKLVLMIITFLLTLFVMSWWLVPIRFLFKKYGNITFYCKNKKGD